MNKGLFKRLWKRNAVNIIDICNGNAIFSDEYSFVWIAHPPRVALYMSGELIASVVLSDIVRVSQ